jgi:hypothetical protein
MKCRDDEKVNRRNDLREQTSVLYVHLEELRIPEERLRVLLEP